MTAPGAARDRSAPIIVVKVDVEGRGAERVNLSHRILKFSYEDNEKKADKLTLTVDNWDLQNFDHPIWYKGNILEVQWGYPGDLAPVRLCKIQKVTGFQQLTVEALSKVVLLHQQHKTKPWVRMTRSQVVRAIAEANGYTQSQIHVQDTETVYPHIIQGRMTDAQLLKKLAHLEGFEFYEDFDGLHWHPRDLGQPVHRVFTWYTPPRVGDIMEIGIENDVTSRAAKVTLHARDPIRKLTFKHAGENNSVQRTGPGGDYNETVTKEEAEAFTISRSGELVPSQKRNVHEEVRTSQHGSEDAVKKEAHARYLRATQPQVKLTMKVIGDPTFFAKSVVEIQGISRRLSGKYYVKAVTHRIDEGGYVCEAQCISGGGHHANVGAKSKASGNSNTAPTDADQLRGRINRDGSTSWYPGGTRQTPPGKGG